MIPHGYPAELKRGLFASHADGLLTYTNIYARIKVSNKDTVVKIDFRSHKSGYVYIFPRIFGFFVFYYRAGEK